MNTDTDHLYTDPEEAVVELLRRRHDHCGTAADELDELLSEAPSAILFRQVATPNFETLRFIQVAKSMGLLPLILEYTADRFVTQNECKLALGQMRFTHAPEEIKVCLPRKRTVMDMNKSQGAPIHSARTLWGQDFVEFHHELFAISHRLADHRQIDMSTRYQKWGGCAKHYYTPFFRALLNKAILFETFVTSTPEESRFNQEVVMPAFATVANEGRKPLICRLDPAEMEGASAWYYYPKDLEAFVEARLETITPPRKQNRPPRSKQIAMAA